MRTAIVSALLICALVGRVLADDPATDARAQFARGEALVRAGQYVEADAAFTAGYALSKKPLFLFNIAECARLAGDRQRALESYERYVAEAPGGKLAHVASERIEALRKEIAALPRPPAPSATPAPSPAPTPTAPPPAPTAPAPVEAPRPGPALGPPVPERSGATLVVAPPPAKKPIWRRTGFWIGIGAGAAVVIAGASLAAWGVNRTRTCAGTCVDLGQ